MWCAWLFSLFSHTVQAEPSLFRMDVASAFPFRAVDNSTHHKQVFISAVRHWINLVSQFSLPPLDFPIVTLNYIVMLIGECMNICIMYRGSK